jgi:hypothetical protein
MKSIKSERLKKLESELTDLEQWLQLGLVPKKDLEKHKEEMRSLQNRIEEEKERLQFLKEGGETEEFIVPKRGPSKAGYAEMPTIPDVDLAESSSGLTESGFDRDTSFEETTLEGETEEGEIYATGEFDEAEGIKPGEEKDEEEEDESYFSDRNRWKRGGIVDPDADEW